jgi:hypothetical protein
VSIVDEHVVRVVVGVHEVVTVGGVPLGTHLAHPVQQPRGAPVVPGQRLVPAEPGAAFAQVQPDRLGGPAGEPAPTSPAPHGPSTASRTPVTSASRAAARAASSLGTGCQPSGRAFSTRHTLSGDVSLVV